MRSARILVFCCGLIAVTQVSALGDVPELKALSPAGVQSGNSVTSTIIGKAGTAPVRAWCNRDDVSLQVSEKGDQLTIAACPDAPPGLCWIRLYNSEGASALRPFFIGLLPEVTENEPNNSIAQAQPLEAAGVTLNGVLHRSGEVDTFAVVLQAGQTLVASLESAYTLGSPMDGVLQLLSPDGFVLRQNDDDHGIDPQLDFTVPADGRYFVRVFAFPKDPNSSIQFAGGDEYIYRLTVTTGPFVDHIIPLAEDGTSRFALRGWNLPADAAAVAAEHFDRWGDGHLPYPGAWQFERMPIAGNDILLAGDAAPFRLEQLPATVWGTIAAPGDEGLIAFSAGQGDRITLSAAARRFASLLDPLIEIADASGKVLQTADDAGGNFDPELTFEVPAAGEYQVRIRDRFAHGGPRYVYPLRIEPESDVPVIRLEQDAFSVKAGASLEIPVTINGSLGEGEAGVAIEGLPAGYTVTFTAAAAENREGGRRRNRRDSSNNKSTIKIEAPADSGYAGPISIVFTPPGESSSPQTAEASLPGLSLTTRHLWLTTTPAN